jgi:hypothetical protein
MSDSGLPMTIGGPFHAGSARRTASLPGGGGGVLEEETQHLRVASGPCGSVEEPRAAPAHAPSAMDLSAQRWPPAARRMDRAGICVSSRYRPRCTFSDCRSSAQCDRRCAGARCCPDPRETRSSGQPIRLPEPPHVTDLDEADNCPPHGSECRGMSLAARRDSSRRLAATHQVGRYDRSRSRSGR